MEPFTAVVTTGIYCRAKGCPGAPLRRNMRAYAFAAAAEADGFRPCLRCRPDRVPDTGWIDSPELVCRAMRAISAGALDDATEDELAEQLGVSARHLRRLFVEHIGATPSAVARSKRAHFARRLLDDTDLSMTAISTASGFNSVRQMNRVMKEVFRFTPQELRARRRVPDRLVTDGGLELRVPYCPPLAWNALLAFLAPRAIPGVEAVDLDAGVYRRTVRLQDAPGVIEVWDDPDDAALRLRAHLPDYGGLVHLVGGVRRLFDLDADPVVIDTALARDRRLRPLVRARRGLRVPGALDPFELGVRAILGQQVSVAGATTLAGRLVDAHGRRVPGVAALGLTHLFPTPSRLARADLSAVGLPAARADAIRSFAAATAAGRLRLDGRSGVDQTVHELTELRGIGPWTAQYVAMRACGEPDVFPAADLGLRKALAAPDAKSAAADAAAFAPWRSYAAMHLWSASAA
jgi:AraC family transcriptional regulator of adaptative response / DNA-3-methyladenine glycosylase II